MTDDAIFSLTFGEGTWDTVIGLIRDWAAEDDIPGYVVRCTCECGYAYDLQLTEVTLEDEAEEAYVLKGFKYDNAKEEVTDELRTVRLGDLTAIHLY